MALVLCPDCGEETLDQMTSCPLCNRPLTTQEAPGTREKKSNTRLFIFGLLFIGGLAVATLLNILGHTRFAMAIGTMGVIAMLVLLGKLLASR